MNVGTMISGRFMMLHMQLIFSELAKKRTFDDIIFNTFLHAEQQDLQQWAAVVEIQYEDLLCR